MCSSSLIQRPWRSPMQISGGASLFNSLLSKSLSHKLQLPQQPWTVIYALHLSQTIMHLLGSTFLHCSPESSPRQKARQMCFPSLKDYNSALSYSMSKAVSHICYLNVLLLSVEEQVPYQSLCHSQKQKFCDYFSTPPLPPSPLCGRQWDPWVLIIFIFPSRLSVKKRISSYFCLLSSPW